MKKSLIAMALMFGAVVFVMPSCGGDDDKKETPEKTCTVQVVKADGSKVNSVIHTGSIAESKLPVKDGENTTGDDAAKGSKYAVSCQ
jgi:hypothetical protein